MFRGRCSVCQVLKRTFYERFFTDIFFLLVFVYITQTELRQITKVDRNRSEEITSNGGRNVVADLRQTNLYDLSIIDNSTRSELDGPVPVAVLHRKH
jgi:hypothetical protein